MSIDLNIIGKVDANTQIYRIFRRDRFMELFQNNENALVWPTKWDDPFENVMLKAEVVNQNGERGSFSFHDDVYGQCWTLEQASDAMWQIYSRQRDAIRVRTTAGRLLQSVSAVQGDWAGTTCFLGRVDYLKEEKLVEFGRTVFREGIDPLAIARSLLVKRRAYKHENEVRLIYIEREAIKHENGVYKYPLNLRTLVDQVMVDGRVAYDDFLPLKKELVDLTGLPENQVKRSLLYREPEGFVVEI